MDTGSAHNRLTTFLLDVAILIPLATIGIAIVAMLVSSVFTGERIQIGAPLITPTPTNTPEPTSTLFPATPTPITQTVSTGLSTAHNGFGLQIFKTLYANDPSRNVIISPTSLSLAFTMLYNGAAGETKSILREQLEYSDNLASTINSASLQLINELPSPDITLDIANSLWTKPDLPVLDDFIITNKEFLKAEIRPLTTANEVNSWVSEKTKHKIDTIIDPPLRSALMMMLINAIYFNGTWTYEFDPTDTYSDTFNTPNGPSDHDFMTLSKDDFMYLDNSIFQSVWLSYGEDERYGMYIIVPKNDVSSVIDNLYTDTWDNWTSSFTNHKGYVRIPKFKLAFEEELKDELTSLGMGNIFSDSANFSKMSDVDLSVGLVKHKTFIEVDEEGTEAAAVTSIGMFNTSVQPEDSSFSLIANKPFLFAITDSITGEIVFIGTINNPSEN